MMRKKRMSEVSEEVLLAEKIANSPLIRSSEMLARFLGLFGSRESGNRKKEGFL